MNILFKNALNITKRFNFIQKNLFCFGVNSFNSMLYRANSFERMSFFPEENFAKIENNNTVVEEVPEQTRIEYMNKRNKMAKRKRAKRKYGKKISLRYR
jgi:hypothetical protein